MNLIEAIGFVLSLGAFIFLMFKRIYQDWKRPVDQPDESKIRLQEFLKSLDEEDEEEVQEDLKPLPPPPPELKPVVNLKTQLEEHQFASDVSLEKRFGGSSMVSRHYLDLARDTPYEVVKQKGESKGSALLSRLKSKKEMVILHEIISKPLSFRS